MDFTAPLPERLFFGVVRAAVLGVRSLKAFDWVLMAIIVALVVPIPVYRRGAALGFEGLAVLLAIFFSLVNTYVLVSSSGSSLTSSGVADKHFTSSHRGYPT